jgi:poly-beta-hydroxyalkanoate depolymerase
MGKEIVRKVVRLAVFGCAAAMFVGCSIGNSTDNPFVVTHNANGKPTVWDCMAVQMSSPPKYACSDNKTYTAFQLRDLRLASEAPPSKEASK